MALDIGSVGFAMDPAYIDCVGVGRDGVVHKIEVALLAVNATVGQPDFDAKRLEASSRDKPLAKVVHSAHCDWKGHVHRVLADDG